MILIEIILLITVVLPIVLLLCFEFGKIIYRIKVFFIHRKEDIETKLVLSDFVSENITKCDFPIIILLESAYIANNIDSGILKSEVGDAYLEYYIDKGNYYELMVKIRFNDFDIPKEFILQKDDNRIISIKRNQKLKILI